MLNKKGQAELAQTAIFWTIMVFMLTMVIITFALILGNYRNDFVEIPPQLQAELISLRFTNVDDCFALSEQDIVQPGIIDLNKFTNQQMDNCYQAGKDTYNFRLLLKENGKELHSENYANIDHFTLFKPVIVKKDNQLARDQLIIYVQEKIG